MNLQEKESELKAPIGILWCLEDDLFTFLYFSFFLCVFVCFFNFTIENSVFLWFVWSLYRHTDDPQCWQARTGVFEALRWFFVSQEKNNYTWRTYSSYNRWGFTRPVNDNDLFISLSLILFILRSCSLTDTDTGEVCEVQISSDLVIFMKNCWCDVSL